MRSPILILLVSVILVPKSRAQDSVAVDSSDWLKGFTVSAAPFAFLHGEFGRGLRIGCDKGFGQNSAVGLETTFFIPGSKYLTDITGTRIRLEYRHYFAGGIEDGQAPYFGLSMGLQRQYVSAMTSYYQGNDSLVLTQRARYLRSSEFFRAGLGFRGWMTDRWFVDYSIWLGFRHRDVDLIGKSESAEKHTDIVGSGGEVWVKTAMNTRDYISPDLSISLRFGYRIPRRK